LKHFLLKHVLLALSTPRSLCVGQNVKPYTVLHPFLPYLAEFYRPVSSTNGHTQTFAIWWPWPAKQVPSVRLVDIRRHAGPSA